MYPTINGQCYFKRDTRCLGGGKVSSSAAYGNDETELKIAPLFQIKANERLKTIEGKMKLSDWMKFPIQASKVLGVEGSAIY